MRPCGPASEGGVDSLRSFLQRCGLLLTLAVSLLCIVALAVSQGHNGLSEAVTRQLSAAGNETHTDSGGGHHSQAVGALVFFLVAFFASALALFLTNLLPEECRPPHSVLLYFIGTFLAALSHTPVAEHSDYNFAMEAFSNLDPNVIFWVMLPALLFEDAAGAEWPVIQRVLPSALLLALPGVIVNTVLTGVFVRFVMREWAWDTSMLLGTILSATDPVAVVGALLALAAPAKLSHLISGEALFNDGSAVALFWIFLNVATGSEFRLGEAIVKLVRLAIGGPLFGLVVALVSHLWLRSVKQLNCQVLIILTCVYGCFFIGEHKLEVSGVLAVVFFGLYMSASGRFSIISGEEHSFHEVMRFLSLISHESIFIIAGVIGYKFLTSDAIQWRDYLDCAMLYVAIHVTRTLVIVVFYPLLSRMGYGLSLKEAIICIYGGLRGAVGLAMASVVADASQLGPDSKDAQRIGFHTAGIVILTLFINGTTVTALYKWLKVGSDKVNRHHDKLLRIGLKQIDVSVEDFMQEVKTKHWFFHNCDFDIIAELVPKMTTMVDHDKLDYFGKKRMLHHEEVHIEGVVRQLAEKFAQAVHNDPSFMRQHCMSKVERSRELTHVLKDELDVAYSKRSFHSLTKELGGDKTDMMSEVYQAVVNATGVEYAEAFETGRVNLSSYKVLSRSLHYQEEAIWGELGLPKYGVPYPHFLDNVQGELHEIISSDRSVQMNQSFSVGWMFIANTFGKPQVWYTRLLERCFGNHTVALDWVYLTRDCGVILQYVASCQRILEDTALMTGFAELLNAPLTRVMDQALTTALEKVMHQDIGMFILVEHILCARLVILQMRHMVRQQVSDGTLQEEDAERLRTEVMDPTLHVLENFLPTHEHLDPVKSAKLHKIHPKLDAIVRLLVFEKK